MAKKSKQLNSLRIASSVAVTFVVALILASLTIGYFLFERERPQVAVSGELAFLGKSTSCAFSVTDHKTGLRSVRVFVGQKGKQTEVYAKEFPRTGWLKKVGPAELTDKVTITAKQLKLEDGEAELVITARDFSLNDFFQGSETVLTQPVLVDTHAPAIVIKHSQRQILTGGSGVVLYTLSEPAVKHGVRINDHFFPGFPLQNREGRFVSYIALDWNATQAKPCEIEAFDRAGNLGRAPFTLAIKKAAEKFDRITITDSFLQAKIPEFEEHYPELSGTDIEKYIQINNGLRKRDADTIMKICATPHPEKLWHDRFIRMPGASRAGFADQRTYYYQDQPVDKQTHLGMDIASLANAEIRAANRGKVVFADYLGIYGNMIILDHGQGIFSLYSHLSTINTTVGEMVEKDTVIGHSGATGMAGGDHLHFAMLVHGIFTSPIEWWDQHWLDVTIHPVLNDENL